MWVWLKIKQEGLRRFWSMFPLTRASHFGTGFLSHSHVVTNDFFVGYTPWLVTHLLSTLPLEAIGHNVIAIVELVRLHLSMSIFMADLSPIRPFWKHTAFHKTKKAEIFFGGNPVCMFRNPRSAKMALRFRCDWAAQNQPKETPASKKTRCWLCRVCFFGPHVSLGVPLKRRKEKVPSKKHIQQELLRSLLRMM